ncbi:DUF6691 family protein [Devosia psychrophila]|uniref:Sulphur transport domain-containing protein n=1 Tax=Devosia psychrophila TaxID=728005 RepID=A0A0F5PUZ2_9HYPH|nr:DUF6691 family protein [Devosia psychrophila]KKC32448.1 hypothetical protein WH91_14250 [Devosia psychrophila]SFC12490.1 hypothetical protein SAMN04488059_102220 [Devosia psychrophila]
MASLKLPYLATAALSGSLFGAGLYVSQMVDPLKVLRFLDFGAIPSGGWDPSLAFVIGPAIIVMFIAVQLGKRRQAPLFDSSFHEPASTKIDTPLVAGAAMFGIGWGMAGICPGPAISLIAFLPDNLWIFLVAMFAGSFAGSFILPSSQRLVNVL